MFDNLLNQKAEQFLIQDIKTNSLPNSLLFSGPKNSGKFTCALELARVLSCREQIKGQWLCTCPSCLKHKALQSTDVIIAGNKDTALEIAGAKQSLLEASYNNASYLQAVRYLFIRSVRKLTNRFSPIIWEGEKDIAKISIITQTIDELLEEMDPLRPILPMEKLEKNCEKLYEQCLKLESNFMYNSLPIAQIRNISSWARYTIAEGKKLVILENADKMLENVRNAVLKILEEPPKDCLFVLTTTRRSAIIPTILSRVRTYNFVERTAEQKKDLVERIFHTDNPSVDDYLLSFLPVEPTVVQNVAINFWNNITKGKIVNINTLVNDCNNFKPRVLLRLFFNILYQYQKKYLLNITDATKSAGMIEKMVNISAKLRDTYDKITIYNQSPESALENLATELMR
ncbi:MAG: DNA polymerase III [Treponema sp.]|nr:DNA polymerase III [Treponema sp.]